MVVTRVLLIFFVMVVQYYHANGNSGNLSEEDPIAKIMIALAILCVG